jgi:hypothetical protein
MSCRGAARYESKNTALEIVTRQPRAEGLAIASVPDLVLLIVLSCPFYGVTPFKPSSTSWAEPQCTPLSILLGHKGPTCSRRAQTNAIQQSNVDPTMLVGICEREPVGFMK